MARKLAPLKQSSPKSRIRHRGSAAPEGEKTLKKQSNFMKDRGLEIAKMKKAMLHSPKNQMWGAGKYSSERMEKSIKMADPITMRRFIIVFTREWLKARSTGFLYDTWFPTRFNYG